MRPFKHYYRDHRALQENYDLHEIANPYLLVPEKIRKSLEAVVSGAALVAIQRGLIDIIGGGIRIVGRNPLKTAFALLAFDQVVRGGRGTDALITYLENDFGRHAAVVVDTILRMVDEGISLSDALNMMTSILKS